MGALVSLFITLISLTVSLLMTMINLLVSVLGRGARASILRQGSRKSSGALGGFVLMTIVVLIALAAAPRATVVLGLIVLAVLLARRLLGGPRTLKAKALAQRLEVVRAMTGAQFEIFVADLFRAMGYNATVLGGSGDQGVDVIVNYQGERVAVQCKNYGKAVGNKPIQEVYAGSRFHGCSDAWVIAPAGFTKGAVELARRVGVALYDANAIRTWIRRIDENKRRENQPSNKERRTVDLDAGNTGLKEDTTMDSGMEKHTISVGSDRYGETVAFTANMLGTAEVNGGQESPDGLDLTIYRLPDNTYRMLAERGKSAYWSRAISLKYLVRTSLQSMGAGRTRRRQRTGHMARCSRTLWSNTLRAGNVKLGT